MSVTKFVGGLFIFTAVTVWAAIQLAIAAEPIPDPPLVKRPALTVERAGDVAVSITVYDDKGAVATLRPDGSVDVHKGTPEQAAQLFFAVVSQIRCE